MALVTGASKGIGASVGRRLAHDGFDVAVHYNTDERGAKETAVRKAGRNAVLVHADLAEPDGARRGVDDERSAPFFSGNHQTLGRPSVAVAFDPDPGPRN